MVTNRAGRPGNRRRRTAMARPSFRGVGIRGTLVTSSSEVLSPLSNDRASAAAALPDIGCQFVKQRGHDELVVRGSNYSVPLDSIARSPTQLVK
jgi:hypothetical protein